MCCSNHHRRHHTPATVTLAGIGCDNQQLYRTGSPATAAGSFDISARGRISHEILNDSANGEIKSRIAESAHPPRYEDVVVPRAAMPLEPEPPGLEVAGQQEQGRWVWSPECTYTVSRSHQPLSPSPLSDGGILERPDGIVDGLGAMFVTVDSAGGTIMDPKALRKLAKERYKSEKKARKATHKDEKAAAKAIRKLERRASRGKCC